MNHHPTHRWIVAAAAISISLSACGHVLSPVLGASAVPVDLVQKVQRPAVDPEMRRFERLQPPAVDPDVRRFERLRPPAVDPEVRRFERLQSPAVDPEVRRFERLVPGTPGRPTFRFSHDVAPKLEPGALDGTEVAVQRSRPTLGWF